MKIKNFKQKGSISLDSMNNKSREKHSMQRLSRRNVKKKQSAGKNFMSENFGNVSSAKK